MIYDHGVNLGSEPSKRRTGRTSVMIDWCLEKAMLGQTVLVVFASHLEAVDWGHVFNDQPLLYPMNAYRTVYMRGYGIRHLAVDHHAIELASGEPPYSNLRHIVLDLYRTYGGTCPLWYQTIGELGHKV